MGYDSETDVQHMGFACMYSQLCFSGLLYALVKFQRPLRYGSSEIRPREKIDPESWLASKSL